MVSQYNDLSREGLSSRIPIGAKSAPPEATPPTILPKAMPKGFRQCSQRKQLIEKICRMKYELIEIRRDQNRGSCSKNIKKEMNEYECENDAPDATFKVPIPAELWILFQNTKREMNDYECESDSRDPTLAHLWMELKSDMKETHGFTDSSVDGSAGESDSSDVSIDENLALRIARPKSAAYRGRTLRAKEESSQGLIQSLLHTLSSASSTQQPDCPPTQPSLAASDERILPLKKRKRGPLQKARPTRRSRAPSPCRL